MHSFTCNLHECKATKIHNLKNVFIHSFLALNYCNAVFFFFSFKLMLDIHTCFLI